MMSAKIEGDHPGPGWKDVCTVNWVCYSDDEYDCDGDWDGEIVASSWIGYCSPDQHTKLLALTCGGNDEDAPQDRRQSHQACVMYRTQQF